MAYIPNTDANRRAMMDAIGIDSVEELLSVIPREVRQEKPLNLPPALSELELHDTMGELAARNGSADRLASFVGGGMYDHFVPSAIGHLASRSEFLTSYTPYQPEVSQGTLQGIYEFQTMICELTGLDVANASMYDGASATAEAAMLARSATRRNRVLLAGSLHPHYVETVYTYAHGPGIEVETLPCPEGTLDPERLAAAISDDTACVIVQHPNFLGCLESMRDLERVVHGAGALLVMAVDAISLGVIESPGAYGADIAVGEGQSMGNQVSFGGPALGFFAARERYVRRMPGRIAGQTVDQEDRRGFVLTLQAPRAAHPKGQGDIEHLHQPAAQRPYGDDLPVADRKTGVEGGGGTVSAQEPLRGGPDRGTPGLRTGVRQAIFQGIRGTDAGMSRRNRHPTRRRAVAGRNRPAALPVAGPGKRLADRGYGAAYARPNRPAGRSPGPIQLNLGP